MKIDPSGTVLQGLAKGNKTSVQDLARNLDISERTTYERIVTDNNLDRKEIYGKNILQGLAKSAPCGISSKKVIINEYESRGGQ